MFLLFVVVVFVAALAQPTAGTRARRVATSLSCFAEYDHHCHDAYEAQRDT